MRGHKIVVENREITGDYYHLKLMCGEHGIQQLVKQVAGLDTVWKCFI